MVHHPHSVPPRQEHRRIAKAAWLAAACGLAWLPTRAHAQLLERYEPSGIPGYPDWFTDSAQTAPVTGYEPMPVKLGNVNVDPVLTEGAGYDSNILNTQKSPIDSAFVETNAALHVGTDWTRNAVDLSITADDMRYLSAAPQSYTNWSAAAGGRLDIGAEDAATAAFTHANLVSLPTQIGTFGFFQPITTVIDDGRIGYQMQLGRFTLGPSLDVASYTNSGGGPGSTVRLDDRIAYTGTLSLAYALSTGASLVVLGSDTEARFSNRVPGRPSYTYNDASVLVGVDIHPEGVLRYRALIGYEQLDYASGGLSGVSAPAAEFDTVWQPTMLTTFTGRITQSLQNSPGTATGNYTYTAVHSRVDHAYLRNLNLDAALDYQKGDFTDTNEHQSVFTVSAGARWELNRGLALAINESFQALQASGILSRSTTRNVISLQITLRPGAFD